MSRVLATALALSALVAAPAAFANEASATALAVTPKVGQTVRDANGRRLGPIESVRGDHITVIMDMHMYRIPLASLKVLDKGFQTSLTRSELR